MLIEWEDEYSVGVKEIDEQHKKLFSLINSLFESMKESSYKKTPENIFQELLDYAKLHLKTEEDYFEKFNYPEKDVHKKTHDLYRSKISEFIKKKDNTFLSFEIIDFLEDWWLGHIVSTDKKYQKFFKEHGLK